MYGMAVFLYEMSRRGDRKAKNDVVMGSLQQVEGAVFGCLHDLALARTFVVDAAKVEYAVDHDAMQLFVERQAAVLGVRPHCIDGDVDVALYDIALAVIESDDVGIIVMTEILAVHFEYLLVVNEHITDLANLATIRSSYLFNPSRSIAFANLRHLYVF